MDGLEDFRDLQGNNVNDFIKAYRDELKNDFDANVSNLQQQRRNDMASIMSNANKRGMMYSNFPERSKLQYEANTYLPNYKNIYSSYQTGLDKLRSNALSTYNNIKSLQSSINDLNESYKNTNGNTSTMVGNYTKDNTGTQFVDEDGNPIRFSTWAVNNGATDNESLLKAAEQALNTAQYNQLKRIVDAQKGTSHSVLKRNTGKNFYNVDYYRNGEGYLSKEDSDFINSLGLGF